MSIRSRRPQALLPGVLLCVAVALAAYGAQWVEARLAGAAWLEALVIAILLGTLIRSLWTPSSRWTPGIAWSGKTLLEIAVVLLGASVSAAAILEAGPSLLLGIAVVVVLAILFSFAVGRAFGLPARMALLIACGNSICGNSAIAAVAPVIRADARDVAASIAFTAVLGVVVVLGLPLLALWLNLSEWAGGVFAGLTVYAVPQVIAAAAPMGALALQTGTLVKLVRVLMLGPVCLVLSLLGARFGVDRAEAGTSRLRFSQLVPWFILGFLALVAVRSLGLVPDGAVAPIGHLATMLTVVSMAALGLGVDIRVVARAGGRVTATVMVSLLGLGAMSFALLHLLHDV